MTTRIAAVPAAAAALALALAGCGAGEPTASGASGRAAAATRADALQPVDKLRRHPRAVDPAAGVVSDAEVDAGRAPAGVTETASEATLAALPKPRTDAQIKAELARSGIAAGDRAQLTGDGLAIAPLDAPPTVQAVISAANQIARLPYRYGGGHQTFIDNAYDCSASLSFAFAAAGLLSSPMDSSELSRWGDPGPGRWITIFANAGHTFMYVAGVRFDTGGLRVDGSRWQATPRSTAGFVVRHPVGL